MSDYIYCYGHEPSLPVDKFNPIRDICLKINKLEKINRSNAASQLLKSKTSYQFVSLYTPYNQV